MRKLRDFETELQALNERTRGLKARRVQQLGEMVIACGADALDADTLVGALILAIEDRDGAQREACRARGAGFFQVRSARTRSRAGAKPRGNATVAASEGADRPGTSA